MDDHIWRVPIIQGVMACSAISQFAAAAVTSAACRGRSSIGGRLAGVFAIVTIAVAFGFALRATVRRIAQSMAIDVAYLDAGALEYVAPSIAALFIWVVASRLLRGVWVGHQALTFYGWVLFFTAANIINSCSPGWCMALGFPMPWYGWSDVIIVGAEGVRQALHIVGAFVDAGVFVVGGWAITRRVRK